MFTKEIEKSKTINIMKPQTTHTRVFKGMIVLFVMLFLSAAGFQDKMTSSWTLQVLPNLNGAQISDVTFTDSLTGYFVTNNTNGTAFLNKTTNGGDNWVLNKTSIYSFTRIIFLDKYVGFTNSFNTLFKTTNSGANWDSIPLPGIYGDDLFVLNKDTLWLAMGEGLTGGVYRSTNGGLNWTNQFYQFNRNPDKIYMVNKNLGFIRRGETPFGSYIGRTTNGGANWSIQNEDSTFSQIKFIDTLTGWMTNINIKKTTDGGITWFVQNLPTVAGSIYNVRAMGSFSLINKDTLYGVGGWFKYPNNQSRCLVYKTTNGGLNWGYQIPDTSFNIFQLRHIFFMDNNRGWAFMTYNRSIHTSNGGSDTTFYTGINNNENQIVSTDFVLEQNYPNPFNPFTVISFKLSKSGNVKLNIFDITGKKISTLVNEYKHSGNYSVTFNAQNLPSGIYFYSMIIDGNIVDTKKMICVK